jgi:hypothetical protein
LYWKGKKRDTHTINRLSESKFKKVVQYDSKGSELFYETNIVIIRITIKVGWKKKEKEL